MSDAEKKVCGVVMPISTIENCSEVHWGEVLGIISSAIEAAGFEANLVSNADEVGIIHKRIIQNLYENPIVVCDVSAKNPNVMFELGMRLAFDKPTIIIKDDKTTYSFDTGAIEHLEYPRDLRFSQIVEFKEKLASKLKATYEKSINDREYTTFLKHFGEFKVAKIERKEVTGQEYILEEIKAMRHELRRLDKVSNPYRTRSVSATSTFTFELDIPKSMATSSNFTSHIKSFEGVSGLEMENIGSDTVKLRVYFIGGPREFEETRTAISLIAAEPSLLKKWKDVDKVSKSL